MVIAYVFAMCLDNLLTSLCLFFGRIWLVCDLSLRNHFHMFYALGIDSLLKTSKCS